MTHPEPSSFSLVTPAVKRSDRIYFDAIDPVNGKLIPHAVAVSHDRGLFIARLGKGPVLELRDSVALTLRSPVSIFRGIRCDDDESRRSEPDGMLCYVGTPRHYYLTDGRTRIQAPGHVFLVFVNVEQVAYNWRWEESDKYNVRLPKDYKSRFHRQEL